MSAEEVSAPAGSQQQFACRLMHRPEYAFADGTSSSSVRRQRYPVKRTCDCFLAVGQIKKQRANGLLPGHSPFTSALIRREAFLALLFPFVLLLDLLQN